MSANQKSKKRSKKKSTSENDTYSGKKGGQRSQKDTVNLGESNLDAFDEIEILEIGND